MRARSAPVSPRSPRLATPLAPLFHALLLALPAAPLSACSEHSRTSPPSTTSSSTPAAPSTPSAFPPASAPAPPAKQGSIEGLIHFTGQAPPPIQVSIPASLSAHCGEQLLQPRAVAGKDGGLSEVVAWVDGAQGPLSAAPPPPVLDQRGCAFRPRVVAAARGTELTVLNSDPLLHNVRATSGTDRPFNTAMPITGMKIQVPVATAPGVTRVTCDVHPWMLAFIRSFDHPFFAVSDEAGRFAIRGVPAGKAVLRFWHPFLGERQVGVDVPEGGIARPQVDWPAP
jgi:plastocyanin